MKKFLIVWLISGVLYACTSSGSLVNNLSKYKIPLGYQHDSDIALCEQKTKIAIGAVRTDTFDVLTAINKTRRSIYPFLFFNSFTNNFWVNLGENSLERSFRDFFLDSFLEESNRTGCYTIVDDPKEADYIVDFILKDYKTESKYQVKNQVLFLICFLTTSYQESGFSAATSLKVQSRLTGRSGRSEKNYVLARETPWHKSSFQNTDDLRYGFMVNMAESLSMTTKECIEMIIKDINLNIKYRAEE